MARSEAKHANHFHLIRLGLALLVLLAHAPELRDGNLSRELFHSVFGTLTFGSLAVAGFFILSGYLIAQSWQRNPKIFPFLANRSLRIFPGYVVASVVSILVAGWVSGPPGFFSQLDVSDMLKNAFMLRVPGSPPVYPGSPYPTVNGSLWTIEYEFRCYLLVLLLGVSGMIRNRRGVLGLWLLFLGANVAPTFAKSLWTTHYVNVFVGYPDLVVRFGSLFLAGVVFYLFREKLKAELGKILLAVAILVPALFWSRTAELAVATAGAYLLFAFAFRKSPLLTRFTPRSDISYGVYLYGWPIQKVMLWYWPTISPWWLFLLSALASCVCGALSWFLIEGPCLALKQKLPGARPKAAEAAVAAETISRGSVPTGASSQ